MPSWISQHAPIETWMVKDLGTLIWIKHSWSESLIIYIVQVQIEINQIATLFSWVFSPSSPEYITFRKKFNSFTCFLYSQINSTAGKEEINKIKVMSAIIDLTHFLFCFFLYGYLSTHYSVAYENLFFLSFLTWKHS